MADIYHHAITPGSKVDDFEIIDVLGQGGFGITYLAQDIRLERRVALKEYFPDVWAVRENQMVQPKSTAAASVFRAGIDSFLKEGTTLARFDHPNIVRVLRLFEVNNTAYLVMALIDGLPLDEHVKKLKRQLTENELDTLIEGVGSALALLHENNYLHRDIKPSNIMMRGDGTPILIDFGTTRQAIGVQSRSMSAIVSTGYSPMEQYHSNGNRGPWTDIYSFGAVLYWAITGETPVESSQRVEAVFSQGSDPYKTLRTLRPSGYRSSLLEAVDWAMQLKAGDRPRSLTEWRQRMSAPQHSAPLQKSTEAPPAQPKNVVSTPAPRRQTENEPTDCDRAVAEFGNPFNLPVIEMENLDCAHVIPLCETALRESPNNPRRKFLLARAYMAAKRYQEAASLYQQAATQGYAPAQNNLGMMLDEGLGLAEDETAAVEWFRKAADQGYAVAQNNLGMMFEEGRGVAKNEKAAVKFYHKAAEQGYAVAQNNLGMMLEQGLGVAKNEAAAAEFYRKAAIQGYAVAQNNLGMMLEEGRGIAQDEIAAVEYYRKAAIQGYAMAQNNLGMMLEEGRGVDQDTTAAVEFYRKAATQGYAMAQNNLGMMLEEGYGVAQDEVAALEWYRKAAAQGYRDAQDNLERLIQNNEHLENDDTLAVEEVTTIIEEFIPIHKQVFRDCPACPEMVFLSEGTFPMGSNHGRSDERPLHHITLNAFAIGKYAVTFDEYDSFCVATGRTKPDDQGWGRGRQPVINVSWYDAVAYAEWLSQQTGENYRLPTEAEWEYAARAGTTTEYWWGDNVGRNQANCYGCNSQWDNIKTAEVGSFSANPWGLFDTAGNVWEWTCSEYASYRSGKENSCAENSDTTTRRVLRGGAWSSSTRAARVAYRGNKSPNNRDNNSGFRIVKIS